MSEKSGKTYYDFQGDLSFGEARENDFLSHFNGFITKGSGRIEDLILGNGKTLELKSERYYILDNPPEELKKLNPQKRWKTTSIFIEIKGKKEVGPFRAEKDKVDYYVHYFLDNIAFIFDTKTICDYIRNQPRNKYKEWSCVNRNPKGDKWEALGYLVPAEELVKNKLCKVIRLKKDKDYSYLFNNLDNS